MARILESSTGLRRTIKLSANDIISIVQEYQRITGKLKNIEEIRDSLENTILYLPEEL